MTEEDADAELIRRYRAAGVSEENIKHLRFRDMPDDFWPDLTVSGKVCGISFAFAVQPEHLDELKDALPIMIQALRESLWQAAEFNRLGIPNPTLEGKAA